MRTSIYGICRIDPLNNRHTIELIIEREDSKPDTAKSPEPIILAGSPYPLKLSLCESGTACLKLCQ